MLTKDQTGEDRPIVIIGRGAASRYESATMDEDHDGEGWTGIDGGAWSPNVEVQAIFLQ